MLRDVVAVVLGGMWLHYAVLFSHEKLIETVERVFRSNLRNVVAKQFIFFIALSFSVNCGHKRPICVTACEL